MSLLLGAQTHRQRQKWQLQPQGHVVPTPAPWRTRSQRLGSCEGLGSGCGGSCFVQKRRTCRSRGLYTCEAVAGGRFCNALWTCPCCCRPFGRRGRLSETRPHLPEARLVLPRCSPGSSRPRAPAPRAPASPCRVRRSFRRCPPCGAPPRPPRPLPRYRRRLSPRKSGHCRCPGGGRTRRCSGPALPHPPHFHPPPLRPLKPPCPLKETPQHCLVRWTFCSLGRPGPCDCVLGRWRTSGWSGLDGVDPGLDSSPEWPGLCLYSGMRASIVGWLGWMSLWLEACGAGSNLHCVCR